MTDGQHERVIQHALQYLQRGWCVLPLHGKAPYGKEWQKAALSEEHVPQAFKPRDNLGILHGPLSGHLVDVDLDCPEAVRAAPWLLPATPMRHGRAGSGIAHYWYVCQGLKTQRYDDPAPPEGEKKRMVEVLGEGTQTMVPPSIHPESGEEVRWQDKVRFEPPAVKSGELLKACRRLAACVLIARRWREGDRSERAMLLGGWLSKEGVGIEQAEELLRAICAAARDEEAGGRITSLRHSFEVHERGEKVAGWQGLVDLYGEPVMRQAAKWLGHGTRARRGTRGDAGAGGRQRCGVNLYRYELIEELACTDVGNAARLLKQHGADLRYCRPWAAWLRWDEQEGCWRRDDTNETLRTAAQVARAIAAEAKQQDDTDKRATLLHWASASQSMSRVGSMLELATAARQVAVLPEHLDADPRLLSIRGATLDLTPERLLESDDGPAIPAAREHLLTKLAPVDYDPEAACPLFEQFLSEIFAADQELIAFVQRLAGYCLIGGNPEQYVAIWYGTGANGKTTLLEVLRAVLGDYSATVDPEVLMSAERGGNNQLYALASLRGARLVTASETQEGRQLAESLIKTLTGGEPVMARMPYGAPFEFRPEFTPVLATNHKPEVRDTSHGMWRRILLVPFNVEIADADQDPALPDKLQQELSGVLNWMLAGLTDYYELALERGRGLCPPQAVLAATQAYREEQDVLSEYIESRCELGPPALRVTKTDLYKDYENWCELTGAYRMYKNTFGRKLKAQSGIGEQKSGPIRYWTGIALRHLPTTAPLDLPGGGEH